MFDNRCPPFLITGTTGSEASSDGPFLTRLAFGFEGESSAD